MTHEPTHHRAIDIRITRRRFIASTGILGALTTTHRIAIIRSTVDHETDQRHSPLSAEDLDGLGELIVAENRTVVENRESSDRIIAHD